MFGLNFIEAHNSLVTADAEFVVRGWPSGEADQMYRFVLGRQLLVFADNKWVSIAEKDEIPSKICQILGSRYGYKWTYKDFMLALTFWDEGHKTT